MNKKNKDKLYAYFFTALRSKTGGDFTEVYPPGVANSPYHYYEMASDGTVTKCHLWFTIQKDSQGDSFRLYGSWSLTGDIPLNYAPMHHPIDIPELFIKKDQPLGGKLMFSVPLLWKEKRPRGWPLEGLDEKAILTEIDSAIDHVAQYLVPYFRDKLIATQ